MILGARHVTRGHVLINELGLMMTRKPTYEELEKQVKELNKESTERKLVEVELNTVRAALNSAARGFIITDKKGRIKYANPAFHKMFEYEFQKEVTGKYAAELFASHEGRRFFDIGAIIDKSNIRDLVNPTFFLSRIMALV